MISYDYTSNIFKNINSILIIVSPKGLILAANPFVCKILGYEEDELAGQPIEKVVDLKDLLSAAGWMRYLIKKQNITNIERSFITKDNLRIPAILSTSLVYDENGIIQYILCTAQDITLRKAQEIELSKAQKYAQGIINASMDMIIAVDKDMKITEFNEAAQDIFGYDLEEVIGNHVMMLLPKDVEGGSNVFEILSQKGEFKGEVTHKRKNGEVFVASLSISMLKDIEDNPNGYVGILRDITEKNRLEIELVIHRSNLEEMVMVRTAELTDANKKIKESLQEKEVLLREIHHRVKNNLQIVSSLLESQARYINDEDILSKFKDTQSRITSMALIHESLYQSNSLSKINFAQYIRDIADSLMVAYNIDPSRIAMNIQSDEITLNIETAVPCGLIITEIITNSLKYAFPDTNKSGGCEVTIRFFRNQDNSLTLIIGDNGIGLSKDIDLTKKKSMGLYLVEQLAKRQLDGSLQIDYNNGTLFKISFIELQYKERV